MAERTEAQDPSPELMRRVQALNKLRGRTWARIAAGTPGMSSDILGGMPVSEAVRRHFPDRPTPAPGEFERAKAELLSEMGKLQAQDEDTRAKRKSAVLGEGGSTMKLLELAEKLYSTTANVAQRSAEARAKAFNDAAEARTDALLKQLEIHQGKLDPAQDSRVREVAKQFTPALVAGGLPDHTAMALLEETLKGFGDDDFGKVALLRQLREVTGPDFLQHIENAEENGDPSAKWINEQISGPLRVAAEEAEETLGEIAKITEDAARVAYFSGSGTGMQDYVNAYKTVRGIYDGGEDADERLQRLYEEITGKPKPFDPTAEMEALIEQFEKPEVAPNLLAARDALLASPQFQAYMRQNGFPPGSELQALRGVRTLLRDQRMEARVKGAQARARVETQVGKDIPPPTPSAQLAGAPEGAGADAVQEEITLERAGEDTERYKVVFDPNWREGPVDILVQDVITGEVKSFDGVPLEDIEKGMEEILFEQIPKMNSGESQARWRGLRTQAEAMAGVPDMPSQAVERWERQQREKELEKIMQPEGKKPVVLPGLPSLPELRAAAGNLLLQSTRPAGETVRKVGREVKKLRAESALEEAARQPAAEAVAVGVGDGPTLPHEMFVDESTPEARAKEELRKQLMEKGGKIYERKEKKARRQNPYHPWDQSR